jgi:hypothetical protein
MRRYDPLLGLLHFDGRQREALRLDDAGWLAVLNLADCTQVTLHLCGNLPGTAPEWVRESIAVRLDKNSRRLETIATACLQIGAAFERAGVDFVLLKGLTHGAVPGIHRSRRQQYDLDFWCPLHTRRALGALESLGYRAHRGASLSDQHPSPMLRPNAWTWTGDYFDPEMPVAVEVHPELWPEQWDRIGIPGLEDFRRRALPIAIYEGVEAPALDEPDRFAYACLHVLRHILRNDVRPAHTYELALWLRARAGHGSFWDCVGANHSPRLQLLERVASEFAVRWFGATACGLDMALPSAVRAWFDEFAFSPLENLFQPNKDALWLHMALVRATADRLRVAWRRLVPAHAPAREEGSSEAGSYSAHFAGRARYHLAALIPTLASGARWWRRSRRLSSISQIPA